MIVSLTPQQFQAFAQTHPMGSFMQDVKWAQVKIEWQPVYLGSYQDDQLVVGACVYVRRLGFGLKLGYIPKGPLYQSVAQLKAFLKELSSFGCKQGWVAIKFDCNVYQTLELDQIESLQQVSFDLIDQIQSKQVSHLTHQLGLTRSIQPQVQLAVDLASYQTPKGLMGKLEKAKQAQLKIEFKGMDGLDALMANLELTNKRKTIFLRDRSYFERLLTAYGNQATIVLAFLDFDWYKTQLENQKTAITKQLMMVKEKQKKQLITKLDALQQQYDLIQDETGIKHVGALLLLSSHQVVELLYSGFDPRVKQVHAPTTLRDQAIKWAKQQQATTFNFGGVVASKQDGLFTFKASFEPLIHFYVGEFNLVTMPILSTVYFQLEPRMRRLRMKLAFYLRQKKEKR